MIIGKTKYLEYKRLGVKINICKRSKKGSKYSKINDEAQAEICQRRKYWEAESNWIQYNLIVFSLESWLA